MGETELIMLKKEVRETQEKLCEEKHGTIDRRLEKLESKLDKMFWWIVSVLGTTLVNLVIVLMNK